MFTEEESILFKAGYIKIKTNQETGEQVWADLQGGGLDIVYDPLNFFRRFRVKSIAKSYSTGGVDTAIRQSRSQLRIDSW